MPAQCNLSFWGTASQLLSSLSAVECNVQSLTPLGVPVLPRNDVLDVKAQFGECLRQPAVFTALQSAGSNQLTLKLARRRCHQTAVGR